MTEGETSVDEKKKTYSTQDAYWQLLQGAKSYVFTIANQKQLERQLMIHFTEKHSLARFFH